MVDLLERTSYMPGHLPIEAVDYEPTSDDVRFMAMALELGKQSLQEGNSPIGSVLVHLPTSEIWSGKNTEFTNDDLRGHSEQNAYEAGRLGLGRDLSQCNMYTTAEPCVGCTYMLDKGNLGMLFVGARRTDAPEFFRNRTIGMHGILAESRRSLTVVSGLLLAESKELLKTEHSVHHRHP